MWILIVTSLPAMGQTVSDCADITSSNVGDNAPADYDDLDCNATCNIYFTNTLICAQGSTTTGMEVFAVEDYAEIDNRTFSAWGLDSSGNGFCCFTSDDFLNIIDYLWLSGTDYDDELSLSYNGLNVDNISGSLIGLEGADILVGSASTIQSYPNEDVLAGYEGADTLYGHAGIDYITGMDGADTLFGGDGDDFLYGNDHEDVLDGGNGDDTLDGGSADDILRGRHDNDTLIGGTGSDLLCGGNVSGLYGFDTYYSAGVSFNESPNSVDKLWAPTGPDTALGYAQTGDRCGDSDLDMGWATNCTDDIATAPAGCN